MRRALAVALVVLAVTPAWAKKGKGSDDDDDDTAADDAGTDDDDSDKKPDAKKADKGDKDDSGDEDEGDTGDDDKGDEKAKPDKKQKTEDEPAKQDLTGHDLGTKKKTTEFEKDRFYVDKTDTEKTENGTLVQGSLASSTLFYSESGGAYPGIQAGNDAGPSRMFTELRLQTDFRHIGGGRWDARIDGRTRFVNSAPNTADPATPPNNIQSGFTGQNEYDLRELWLVRNGVRSDVFLGRQYITDLGAIKIDGIRVDYASSNKLTFIGFGGLYPVRGSRSIDTDYIDLKTPGALDPAGKLVAATGGGAAYRTVNAYGAIGGVALVPTQKEQARIFLTSNGYYRAGSTLDFYHYALLDVVSSGGAQLTNLSAGINYKPTQRLRLTASINHVDTDTLAIQAGAFLNKTDTTTSAAGTGGPNVVQNETFVRRLATEEARAGVSAGLGELQRFQLSTALSIRLRPAFTIPQADNTQVSVDAAESAEVWASIVDRHSFKDARIGIEGSQSFAIGTVPYQRNEALYLRGFAGHLIKDGRGELVADLSYLAATDSKATASCTAPGGMGSTVPTCYGNSATTYIAVGGNLFYRLAESWLANGSLSLSRSTTTPFGVTTADPTVTGITAFLRIAYRF